MRGHTSRPRSAHFVGEETLIFVKIPVIHPPEKNPSSIRKILCSQRDVFVSVFRSSLLTPLLFFRLSPFLSSLSWNVLPIIHLGICVRLVTTAGFLADQFVFKRCMHASIKSIPPRHETLPPVAACVELRLFAAFLSHIAVKNRAERKF